MKPQKAYELEADVTGVSLEKLLSLYKNTLLQLQTGASLVPILNQSSTLDEMEDRLLLFQEQLVRSASANTIETTKDLETILKFWRIVRDSEDNGPTLTDELVMSLFRHFVKD